MNTNAAEVKGDEFMQKAEKALNKFSIFSSSGKFEDASDFFEKAGNQYKIAKKWDLASKAYGRCADCQIKLNESSRAAQFYQTSAEALDKVDPKAAVDIFRKAISMLCDSGRFAAAAKLQQKIAENCEREEDFQGAIDNYRQAADYYSGENRASSANGMLLKVAQISAQLEQYDDAMGIFEEVAQSYMDNNLMKYNAKGLLMNAGLCVLATGDQVLINRKLEEYEGIDFSFNDSREGKLFNDLAESFENQDPDAFADAVYQFDSISKLDPWKITLLLTVKNNLGGGDFGGGDITDLT